MHFRNDGMPHNKFSFCFPSRTHNEVVSRSKEHVSSHPANFCNRVASTQTPIAYTPQFAVEPPHGYTRDAKLARANVVVRSKHVVLAGLVGVISFQAGKNVMCNDKITWKCGHNFLS